MVKKIAIAVWLVLAPSFAHAENPMRVVVFGDSLTAGYQLEPEHGFTAQLKRQLQALGYTNIDVVNQSVTANTTTDGLARLDAALRQPADVAVIELGANDVIRGVNPNTIYQNLWTIVNRFKQRGSYVILVGMKAPPQRGEAYAKQLDANYLAIATNHKVAFYPFILEGVVGKRELNLADGFHPNAQGVKVMVQNLLPLVDKGLRAKWPQRQSVDMNRPPAPEEPSFGAPPPVVRNQ